MRQLNNFANLTDYRPLDAGTSKSGMIAGHQTRFNLNFSEYRNLASAQGRTGTKRAQAVGAPRGPSFFCHDGCLPYRRIHCYLMSSNESRVCFRNVAGHTDQFASGASEKKIGILCGQYKSSGRTTCQDTGPLGTLKISFATKI